MTPEFLTARTIAPRSRPGLLAWLRRLSRHLQRPARMDARALSRHMRRDIGIDD